MPSPPPPLKRCPSDVCGRHQLLCPRPRVPVSLDGGPAPDGCARVSANGCECAAATAEAATSPWGGAPPFPMGPLFTPGVTAVVTPERVRLQDMRIHMGWGAGNGLRDSSVLARVSSGAMAGWGACGI